MDYFHHQGFDLLHQLVTRVVHHCEAIGLQSALRDGLVDGAAVSRAHVGPAQRDGLHHQPGPLQLALHQAHAPRAHHVGNGEPGGPFAGRREGGSSKLRHRAHLTTRLPRSMCMPQVNSKVPACLGKNSIAVVLNGARSRRMLKSGSSSSSEQVPSSSR